MPRDWPKDARHPEDRHIRYAKGARLIREWIECGAVDNARAVVETRWKDNGVYLITGGAGGLGLVFVQEIAARARAARRSS